MLYQIQFLSVLVTFVQKTADLFCCNGMHICINLGIHKFKMKKQKLLWSFFKVPSSLLNMIDKQTQNLDVQGWNIVCKRTLHSLLVCLGNGDKSIKSTLRSSRCFSSILLLWLFSLLWKADFCLSSCLSALIWFLTISLSLVFCSRSSKSNTSLPLFVYIRNGKKVEKMDRTLCRLSNLCQ